MYTLKLTRGRSYTGHGITVDNKKPVIEVKEKDIACALINTKRFATVGVSESEAASGDETPIEKMTEKQLEAYAAENGIDLTGISKKADKLAKIQQALGDGGEFDFGENE